MIHVCLWRTATTWSLKFERAEVRLFMNNAAPIAASAMSGRKKSPAFWRYRWPAPRGVPRPSVSSGDVSVSGMSSCTVLTPMLPPAALRPSAKPFSRSG